MEKLYVFSGSMSGKSIIILDNDKIIIKRKGIVAFFTYGLEKELTIMIESINGVNFKRSNFTAGYLQLITSDSKEGKKGFTRALKDKTTIPFFGYGYNKDAEELKNYIEQYNHNVNGMSNKYSDKYEKLDELKKMYINGKLTKEEFEEEKEKLLS